MLGWLRRRRRTARIRRTTECCQIVGDKWQQFNDILKFKDEISLGEKVVAFLPPVAEGIYKHFPDVVPRGDGQVLSLVMLTVMATGQYSEIEIRDAFAEASERLQVIPLPFTD